MTAIELPRSRKVSFLRLLSRPRCNPACRGGNYQLSEDAMRPSPRYFNSKRFLDMSGREKTAFLARLTIFVFSCGFVFPRILSG